MTAPYYVRHAEPYALGNKNRWQVVRRHETPWQQRVVGFHFTERQAITACAKLNADAPVTRSERCTARYHMECIDHSCHCQCHENS